MERPNLTRGALVPLVVALGIVSRVDSADVIHAVDCPLPERLSDERADGLEEFDQSSFRVVDKDKFDKAKENLEATLNWMRTFHNPEIQEAAVCVEKKIYMTNFAINANNKKTVFVGVAPNPQRPQILFSIGDLSGSEFAKEEAAIDVFEAYFIYRKALDDPEGFVSNVWVHRPILEQEARTASLQAFSSVEQINHK